MATAELRVQTDFSWQRLLINACDYIHHPVYLHKNAVSRNLLTIVNRTGEWQFLLASPFLDPEQDNTFAFTKAFVNLLNTG